MKCCTASPVLFIFFSLLVTACDGDSGTDEVSFSDNIGEGTSSNTTADGITADDTTADGTTADGTTADDTEVDQLLPDDDSESSVVCGAIANEVSYEIFNAGGPQDPDNGISVQSPVAGVGWDGTTFCDMDNSVGVTGIAALIPQAALAPDIDGVTVFVDPQWSEQATATSIINGIMGESITRNLLVANVPGYLDGSRSGDWWALHDNDYLYLRFQARNEGSSTGNNQLFRDSSDLRDDDSIDIFIDGNNSKGATYDGVDDFHITVPRIGLAPQPSYGPNSAEGLIYSYKVAPLDAELHFYEIKIDIASAGIEPGRPFGFEIQLNDDDNGGAVDARFGWFEQTGSTVADSNPGVFGTALLTGCPEGNFCGTEQLLDPSN